MITPRKSKWAVRFCKPLIFQVKPGPASRLEAGFKCKMSSTPTREILQRSTESSLDASLSQVVYQGLNL